MPRVNMVAGLLVSAAAVAVLSACTRQESSDAETGGTMAAAVQTSVNDDSSATATIELNPSATVELSPSTAFCTLATKAVAGEFDFTSDERIALLDGDPSLSPRQRALVSEATADAQRQVSEGSYSNDLLVEAVNEICGTSFTPVTMTQ